MRRLADSKAFDAIERKPRVSCGETTQQMLKAPHGAVYRWRGTTEEVVIDHATRFSGENEWGAHLAFCDWQESRIKPRMRGVSAAQMWIDGKPIELTGVDFHFNETSADFPYASCVGPISGRATGTIEGKVKVSEEFVNRLMAQATPLVFPDPMPEELAKAREAFNRFVAEECVNGPIPDFIGGSPDAFRTLLERAEEITGQPLTPFQKCVLDQLNRQQPGTNPIIKPPSRHR